MPFYVDGLLTVYRVQPLDLFQIQAALVNIIIELIAGRHRGKPRPWDFAQWVKIEIIEPVADNPEDPGSGGCSKYTAIRDIMQRAEVNHTGVTEGVILLNWLKSTSTGARRAALKL